MSHDPGGMSSFEGTERRNDRTAKGKKPPVGGKNGGQGFLRRHACLFARNADEEALALPRNSGLKLFECFAHFLGSIQVKNALRKRLAFRPVQLSDAAFHRKQR